MPLRSALPPRALFPGNLKRLRVEQGLTQEALGDLTDINPKQVAQYEGGYKFPSLETLAVLCLVLGCSYEDLVGSPADLAAGMGKSVKAHQEQNGSVERPEQDC